jgi:hypothetical protein
MSDNLRKYFGIKFLVRNCNSIKTVALALQYSNMQLESVFPFIYQNALVSCNYKIIELKIASIIPKNVLWFRNIIGKTKYILEQVYIIRIFICQKF